MRKINSRDNCSVKIYLLLILSFLVVSNISGCDLSVKDAYKGDYIKNILVVNRDHKLGKDYKPENLVIPDVAICKDISDEEKHIDKSIEEPLKNLFNAAKKSGFKLYILSGYRSYDMQKSLYNQRKKENGKKYADLYAAEAGHSEHQTGLALDVTNENRNFSGSKEAKWLAKNSYRYGFIIRYQKGKEDKTGYNYEPWHIRYVGIDLAKKIYESKLSLEEYLGN